MADEDFPCVAVDHLSHTFLFLEPPSVSQLSFVHFSCLNSEHIHLFQDNSALLFPPA